MGVYGLPWTRPRNASLTPDPLALAFGGTAPDAVVEVVLQRVLEAGGAHGAAGADVARDINPDAVAREERLGSEPLAAAVGHPIEGHREHPATDALDLPARSPRMLGSVKRACSYRSACLDAFVPTPTVERREPVIEM